VINPFFVLKSVLTKILIQGNGYFAKEIISSSGSIFIQPLQAHLQQLLIFFPDNHHDHTDGPALEFPEHLLIFEVAKSLWIRNSILILLKKFQGKSLYGLNSFIFGLI